jgi:hypothetical protein
VERHQSATSALAIWFKRDRDREVPCRDPRSSIPRGDLNERNLIPVGFAGTGNHPPSPFPVYPFHETILSKLVNLLVKIIVRT